jgi:hypothetical protein
MSDSKPVDAAEEARAGRLRGAIKIGVAIQVLIYIYLYVYTYQHSNPMGDGMEWVAVAPATFVLAIGALPALALRSNPRLLAVGVLLAFAGVVLNAAFFLEVVRETNHY